MTEVTNSVYERGMEVYRAGEVCRTETRGVFSIRGYLVDTRAMSCECGYYQHHAPKACKHLVAALRWLLDDHRYPKAS